MPTGIETIGLVLATLPLFIEAAKSYAKGVETILDVASTRRRDDRLEEFYDDFWWELKIFDQQVRTLIRSLPYLCNDCKSALEQDISQTSEGWEENEEVARALNHYFGSTSDYQSFTLIVSRILKLLARLVDDKTVHLSGVETDDQMYARLRQFGSDRDAQKTTSSLIERFKFRKKEKDRETCIKNLRTWNKRLLRLTENSKSQRDQVPVTAPKEDHHKASFERFQALSKKMYSALAKYWRCGCADPHEAKLSLENWNHFNARTTKEDLRLEFLVSARTCDTEIRTWQEISVTMENNMTSKTQQKGPCLVKICDAIKQANQSCVNIMIEHQTKEQKIWQLRSQPARLQVSDTCPTRTLQELLPTQFKIGLANKRKLALIFACTLLRLHGGSWLRKWSKEQISFLNSATNVLSYDHPYLSAQFLQSLPASDPVDVNIFHRNPNLLSLGILLIEIDTLQSISSYRTEDENSMPNANTDMLVAERVVKTMDGCSLHYRKAIEACLDTKWVSQSEVNLEEKATLAGYYNRVVLPLEKEWRYLSGA